MLSDERVPHEGIAAIGPFLLALLLRLYPARNGIVDGEVIFYGYDSFYHMRRILFTAENFPSTLWFDSYLDHPWGLPITWPPLFDQVVAGASLLFGLSIEMAGALAAPVLGSASVLVVYLLARRLFGSRVATLSALVLAIDPKQMARTHFGFVDHDALEALLILVAILLLSSALTDRDRRLWFGAAAGVVLAAVGYSWLGAPIYMIGILIYATVQVALDLRDGADGREAIVPLMAAFGVAFLLFLPFREEAWLSPSFFGSLGGLAALAALLLVSRLFRREGLPWLAFFPAVAILGAIALPLIDTSGKAGGISTLLSEGVRYFFWGGLGEDRILEAVPIYRLLDPVSLPALGLAFILLGLGVMILETLRSRLSRDRVLLVVWAAFSLALTIFQARFLYITSFAGSISIALLFFWGADRIRASERWGFAASKAASVALLTILLLPNAIGVLEVAGGEPEAKGAWIEALDWAAENTPATEGFKRPVEAGGYSIISWWDYGNWILYRSRRPVVANNFQAGATDSALFFLAEDEEDALAIADLRGVRYVITDGKMVYGKLPAMVRWIDGDPGSYVSISSEPGTSFRHTGKFMETILSRLHLRDGSELGSFRLVYESGPSPGEWDPAAEVKIFERVAGAKISGTTPYEKPMVAALEMTSNRGRRFVYFNRAMPAGGRYEITVPYSTDEEVDAHSIGPYLVGPMDDFAGGEPRKVEVREEDVALGRVVEVNF
ncbi:MAG: Dolichyl-monophosphooligosaccharide--protein glycosyltransferase AglB [Methanosaeta sp. PtaB.Bin087]|jgi:dolichyl-diphosphooligosaccharide--protein glycosyltransferase|nr:MAG: Dolichyl-monophosphooligosaccharide--protein glycosyltransferase AglB [Methanosaeta sp. PtaB.Bin087]HOI69656.1 STT3 domain-containing protein [Methanothrix sp.]